MPRTDKSPNTSSWVRNALRNVGIVPKKLMGQNFMFETQSLNRVIDAAELRNNDVVIEIGAGLGHLTKELATKVKKVIAVEMDRALGNDLLNRFEHNANVDVILGDGRRINFGSLLHNDKNNYKIVSNLPYNSASIIIRHILESKYKPHVVVTTIQKEVAESIVGVTGRTGLLGTSVKVYAEPEIFGYVWPGAFYPAPKVQSAILKLKVYPKPLFPHNMRSFFYVVRAGFAAPRKQLGNSLAQGLVSSKKEIELIMEGTGVEISRRADTLSIDEWGKITEKILSSGLFLSQDG